MDTLQIKIDQEKPQANYMPVREFYEQMAQRETPYQCNFSFAPLLNKMSGNTKNGEELPEKVVAFMNQVEEELSLFSDKNYFAENSKKIERLVRFLFPNLFLMEKKGFIKVPFSGSFVYVTPEMRAIIESDDWEVKIPEFWRDAAGNSKVNLDIANLALKFFYNVDLDLITNRVTIFRNKQTGLQKFYKINIIQDFVTAKNLKPLKKLSDRQLHDLLDDYENTELWKALLPPENFLFEGIVIGYLVDVTEVEILASIKELLLNEGPEKKQNQDLAVLENMTQSFMNMPDLQLGMVHTKSSFWQQSTSWGLLRNLNKDLLYASLKDEKGIYGRMIKNQKVIIVTDLSKEAYRSEMEKKLLKKGIISLLIIPLFNSKKEIVGIFEIASPRPYAFNRLSVLQMKDLIELFAVGINKFIEDVDSKERLMMQQQFTSIHPSVEWRFREVASKLYWQRAMEGRNTEIEAIVFKNLYPLYGQADIVGSSTLRNDCIQDDLKENLILVLDLMEVCRKKLKFHLLDVYIHRTEKALEQFAKGEYLSSDESEITELITKEINPLLLELKEKFPQLPHKKLVDYFKIIDPQLNIVYSHRKKYEDSVSELNQVIGDFFEDEDEKMQKILPHHFEKYTTDGVEYNIYLGESLIKEGGFSDFFLRDFRLWQLINMCQLTRLVAEKGSQLPIPLTTAQLVFVYNSTLSIRFTMEEKQFDVDGTYNVRYEILKKRIDKAYIKGTEERLTQSGKVAIVYLQEKDRDEYVLYIEHLQIQGYVDGEIEELELEKLQGAEGLKALRFQVKI